MWIGLHEFGRPTVFNIRKLGRKKKIVSIHILKNFFLEY